VITAVATAVALTFGSTPPSAPPAGYESLVDSTEALSLVVPEAWTDQAVSPVSLDDGSEIPFLAASTELGAIYEGEFAAPGVIYTGFPSTGDLLSLMETYGPPRDCESMETEGFYDQRYFGIMQVGLDCGPHHMTWNMVIANRVEEPHFTAMLQIQTADDAERLTILETFDIGPNAASVFVNP